MFYILKKPKGLLDMQYSSRLAIGTHILMCIDHFKDQYKLTSDFLAGSVNVNPVIIRKTLGMLKKAGLVNVEAGIGGASLTKDPSDITLLDVLRAVEKDEDLFHFHENPNPNCPVGRAIHPILGHHLAEAQDAIENHLAGITLADLLAELPQ
jgi:Rrf2 family protein